MSNFIKMRSGETNLFHSDGRTGRPTDRHNKTKSHFSQYFQACLNLIIHFQTMQITVIMCLLPNNANHSNHVFRLQHIGTFPEKAMKRAPVF
jgi:hypothetical protein